MINYFIYAKDYSGSTIGVEFYHKNGLKTLKEFKDDVKKANNALLKSGDTTTESRTIYLHWDDQCEEVDEDDAVYAYTECQGRGGTSPECIIEWLQTNIDMNDGKIKLLYIITDGQIDQYSASHCFELNKNMHYESVIFHAFNVYEDEINLSVATSFLKSHCVVYRNYELFDDTNIAEEFDYGGINLKNFNTEINHLTSYIKLKYINTGKRNQQALMEIEKLKKLRGHLFKELSSLKNDAPKLETTDKNEFIQEFKKTTWYKNLTNEPSQDIKINVEKSISTLINYINSDSKSYAFDALKFKREFKDEVPEEPIVDVDFPTEQEIEFPDIILDDDKGIPVIILTELNLLDKIIFHTSETGDISPASFSKFKSSMECPLFLVNDQDINESIGHFYTLNVYKELLKEEETKRDPLTRKTFHGGLVLLDTDEFDRYNDYVLAVTYFNSKKVKYNIGLFYYVLWKNCEKKEWMDNNVLEQFKKYVMRRISKSVCRIGLSSLPLDPPENTSLLTALWYCVELSSCIFKDDPQHFVHERLRMYYGVAHCMIEILKYFNYDIDLEYIKKRKDLIRHVMILKKIPTHKERVYFLLEKIFKNVNGFLISEIKNPSNLQKLNYLKLNHKSMLEDNVIEEKVHLSDFVHLMYYVDKDSRSGIKLCENTYRPFFTIGENGSFYTELLNTVRKVIINNDGDGGNIKINYEVLDSLEFDKILSEYNLFINCVKDLVKFPTFTEYVDYISKKKRFKEELITIFSPNVYDALEEAFKCYENFVRDVDVNVFIKIRKKYLKRTERIKVEKVRKFNSDNEIEEFVDDQETKVKLKKIKC